MDIQWSVGKHRLTPCLKAYNSRMSENLIHFSRIVIPCCNFHVICLLRIKSLYCVSVVHLNGIDGNTGNHVLFHHFLRIDQNSHKKFFLLKGVQQLSCPLLLFVDKEYKTFYTILYKNSLSMRGKTVQNRIVHIPFKWMMELLHTQKIFKKTTVIVFLNLVWGEISKNFN